MTFKKASQYSPGSSSQPRIELVEPKLLKMSGSFYVTEPRTVREVTSDLWAYIQVRLGHQVATLTLNDTSYDVTGSFALYMPRFSQIELALSSGLVEVDAFLSPGDPTDRVTDTIVFKNHAHFAPKSGLDIRTAVSAESSYAFSWSLGTKNAVARRTRDHIIATYMTDDKLEKVAKTLNLSHAVMTRYFKSAYGLTPVEFRNRLRIAESMKLILMEGKPIVETSKLVGFSDFSQFYRNFRKYRFASPSSYKL